MSRFSLGAFMISLCLLSLVFSSLTVMCVGMDLFVFILHEICWVSWICSFFVRLGELSPLFLQIFFQPLSLLSFWDSHYTYFAMLDVVPEVFESLFIFFFNPFFSLFFTLDCSLINSFSSSSVLSSAISNLPMNPSNEFLFKLLYFPNQNFHLVIVISVSLLRFSIHWDIVILLSFHYLDVTLFTYSNIFIIAALNSLLNPTPEDTHPQLLLMGFLLWFWFLILLFLFFPEYESYFIRQTNKKVWSIWMGSFQQ